MKNISPPFDLAGLGGRLKAVRELHRFSQASVGAALGVTRLTQSKYERGDTFPTLAYLNAAAAMGFDVMYILTGTGAGRSGSANLNS